MKLGRYRNGKLLGFCDLKHEDRAVKELARKASITTNGDVYELWTHNIETDEKIRQIFHVVS